MNAYDAALLRITDKDDPEVQEEVRNARLSKTAAYRLKKELVEKEIKKNMKHYVREYAQELAQSLPEIAPVLKKMATGGDIHAIKEVHEVVGARQKGENVVAVQVNINEDREKYE